MNGLNWPEDFVNKVICGDCLEVMKRIPGSSIPLIITDPPYNVGLNYGVHNDKMPRDEYLQFLYERFIEMARVLSDRGLLYISVTTELSMILYSWREEAGLEWIQNLIWYRPNMAGGSRRIGRPWNQMHEPIMLFKKGKQPKMLQAQINCNTHDVFTIASPQSNYKDGRFHPAQKPLSLYRQLIARSPGDIVLDPFGGAGTLAVSCKGASRDFISIDCNPDYCEITEKRLSQVELF